MMHAMGNAIVRVVDFKFGITGCTHQQQIIWQLFNAIEKGFAAAGDTDTAFLAGKFSTYILRLH